MKRILFSLIPIAFLATVAPANGVIVAQYDFEDTLFGTSTDTDLTSVSGNFTAGTGLTGYGPSPVGDNSAVPFSSSPATGDLNGDPDAAYILGSSASSTDKNGALINNDYLSFTITPVTGFTYNFTQLQFKLAANAVGAWPEGFFVRTNLTVGNDLLTGTNVDVRTADGPFGIHTLNLAPFTALQNVTTPVEFRIYLYNPDGIITNGSDGVNVDKVVVEATVVPEPSACAMIGLSAVLLGAIKRFRRKRS